MERKELRMAQDSFLMLEIKQINSRITLESSSKKFLNVEY
jgi:hypothetical protein